MCVFFFCASFMHIVNVFVRLVWLVVCLCLSLFGWLLGWLFVCSFVRSFVSLSCLSVLFVLSCLFNAL